MDKRHQRLQEGSASGCEVENWLTADAVTSALAGIVVLMTAVTFLHRLVQHVAAFGDWLR